MRYHERSIKDNKFIDNAYNLQYFIFAFNFAIYKTSASTSHSLDRLPFSVTYRVSFLERLGTDQFYASDISADWNQ
jgi:hypothetical protein